MTITISRKVIDTVVTTVVFIAYTVAVGMLAECQGYKKGYLARYGTAVVQADRISRLENQLMARGIDPK